MFASAKGDILPQVKKAPPIIVTPRARRAASGYNARRMAKFVNGPNEVKGETQSNDHKCLINVSTSKYSAWGESEQKGGASNLYATYPKQQAAQFYLVLPWEFLPWTALLKAFQKAVGLRHNLNDSISSEARAEQESSAEWPKTPSVGSGSATHSHQILLTYS